MAIKGQTAENIGSKNNLNVSQQLFANAYLTNGYNATKAYVSAGYSTTGEVSKLGARVRQNVYVKAYIDKIITAVEAEMKTPELGHSLAITDLEKMALHHDRQLIDTIVSNQQNFINSSKALVITVVSQIRDLEEIKVRCMQKQPLIKWNMQKRRYCQDTDEAGTPLFAFDSMGAIRAIVEQNKLLGLNDPDRERNPGLYESASTLVEKRVLSWFGNTEPITEERADKLTIDSPTNVTIDSTVIDSQSINVTPFEL